ncbi:LysM peptidoglycan-binding domain-containing protein [Paenibacillus sp. HB172176]|uniref:LysM peptidoglycan-binding domain-containing protein n=1 Tax=Paenibacillus sp. HB172176 TaxID=2493690 RepID=UPI00143AE9B9|nr:LysM peptidoglycan-binding domain-containing protein [Paenibacillus sp. HB172176]
MKIHMVKSGDTLYMICEKYDVSLEDVLKLNPGITDPNVIDVGMKIKIPSKDTGLASMGEMDIMHQHVVMQGDSLWKLSKAWGVPLATMIAANPQLKNPNVLLTGEVVNIPTANSVVPASTGKTGAAGTGGKHMLHPTSIMNGVQGVVGKLSTAPVIGKTFTGLATDKKNTAPIQEKKNTAPVVSPVPKTEATGKVEPLATKTEPLSTKVEPLATKTEPLSTKVEPLATKTEPLSTNTKVQPSSSNVQPLATKTQPNSQVSPAGTGKTLPTAAQSGKTMPLSSNVSPLSSNVSPLSNSNMMPMGGNAMPLSSNVSPLSGNISPLSNSNMMSMGGNAMPLNSNVSPLSGNVSPLSNSNMMSMGGNAMPLSSNVSPLSGNVSPLSNSNMMPMGGNAMPLSSNVSPLSGNVSPLSNNNISPLSSNMAPMSVSPATKVKPASSGKALPIQKPVENVVDAANSNYMQSMDLFHQYNVPAVEAMSSYGMPDSNMMPMYSPQSMGSNAGMESAMSPYGDMTQMYPQECPPGTMMMGYPSPALMPYGTMPWGYGANPGMNATGMPVMNTQGYEGMNNGYGMPYPPYAPAPAWTHGSSVNNNAAGGKDCGCGGERDEELDEHFVSTFKGGSTKGSKPRKKGKKAVIRTVKPRPKKKQTIASRPWLNR